MPPGRALRRPRRSPRRRWPCTSRRGRGARPARRRARPRRRTGSLLPRAGRQPRPTVSAARPRGTRATRAARRWAAAARSRSAPGPGGAWGRSPGPDPRRRRARPSSTASRPPPRRRGWSRSGGGRRRSGGSCRRTSRRPRRPGCAIVGSPRPRGRVSGRLLVRRLALVQEKDRLELRAHRAQEAEPAFLRPAVRPLVRKDDAVLIGLGAQRDDQPAARAPDAVGADVVLLERPQRLVVVDEDALLAPGGEVARGLLLRRPAGSGGRRCTGSARGSSRRFSEPITS